MIREYSLSVISFLSSNCFKKESCILYLIKLLFFKIFPLSRNKRFMLKRGINRTAGGNQHHGTFTPAWFSRGPTHCLRRFERSDCGCKGVSLAYAPLIIKLPAFRCRRFSLSRRMRGHGAPTDAAHTECVRCPMLRRRYLAGFLCQGAAPGRRRGNMERVRCSACPAGPVAVSLNRR